MSDETEVTTPETEGAGPEGTAQEPVAEAKAEEQPAAGAEADETEAAEAPPEDDGAAVEEPVAEATDEAAAEDEDADEPGVAETEAEADDDAEPADETVAEADDVEEAADDPVPVFEEAAPAAEGPAEIAGLPPVRIARVYVCERGHRTSVLWGEPASCHARPTRSGPVCGLPLYHITELPEQVQRALNPLKASKKASKKK